MTYKILIILTPPFDPNTGGVQMSTYKMSSYFKSQGHDTHVFSYQKNGHAKQDVAKLHTAKDNGGVKSPNNNVQLKELVLSLKPDVVINQMPYEREIGSALSEIHTKQKFLLLGCLRNTLFTVKLNLTSYIRTVMPKYIQSVFNNFLGKQIFLYLHKKKHKKDLQFILDTYDYFVMFGPPNIQELKYFVGDYKLHKTHLIPNSIPTVLAEVPPKEKRILWLSRLGYGQKRADLILPFWKKIMHDLPDWQFDIVGDGNAYNDLKKQIKQENIPRVTLYGKQVPNEYYKRSPIYIMTSENEGFPNTLIEAQSFGAIPVVYDNYPICSWVVKDGESGVLITPFKVDEMADEVIALAKNTDRQNQLMQSSLANAREFSIEKVGKQWIEFFNRELNVE
jgi:glycosyltransferase involved in cell wall biosynthesis